MSSGSNCMLCIWRSPTNWLTHSLTSVSLRMTRHRDPIVCYASIGPSHLEYLFRYLNYLTRLLTNDVCPKFVLISNDNVCFRVFITVQFLHGGLCLHDVLDTGMFMMYWILVTSWCTGYRYPSICTGYRYLYEILDTGILHDVLETGIFMMYWIQVSPWCTGYRYFHDVMDTSILHDVLDTGIFMMYWIQVSPWWLDTCIFMVYKIQVSIIMFWIQVSSSTKKDLLFKSQLSLLDLLLPVL